MRALTTLTVVVVAFVASSCESEREHPLLVAARESAEQHHGEMAPAIPIFRVENLRRAQQYYRDVLGFKVAWEDGDPPDFGAVTRADTTFFLCQQCQGSAAGAWSFVFVKDVDKLHEELRARGARIQMPPKNMPWKLREMCVLDVDGNVIRFASAIKHD